jgi:hypothetical protein
VRGGLSDQATRPDLAEAHDGCRKIALAASAQSGAWRLEIPAAISGGSFIVDFICVEKNVVIEVDSGQHAENEEIDLKRSAYLNKMGYRVLRFWHDEVLRETEAVLTAIFATLADGKQNSPTPRPSPPLGERGSL